RPPSSTPFPYTTLFRSVVNLVQTGAGNTVLQGFRLDLAQGVMELSGVIIEPPKAHEAGQVGMQPKPAGGERQHGQITQGFCRGRSEEHTSELQSRENLV